MVAGPTVPPNQTSSPETGFWAVELRSVSVFISFHLSRVTVSGVASWSPWSHFRGLEKLRDSFLPRKARVQCL